MTTLLGLFGRMAAFLAVVQLFSVAASFNAQGQSVAKAAALRVGVTPTLPPMIFKQGNNIVGVEADFAQKLGQDLGRPIKFVQLSWVDLIDALDSGKVDIIMSSMSITAARQQRVAFTQPYLKIGQMALVRADEQYRYVPLGASRGAQPIGLMKGTTAELFLQQEFPRAQRKYFDSGESAAKALLKKKLNLYLSDSTIVYYLAGKHQADGLAVAPMILSEEMLAWAVRRSDTELLESVNRSLKSMLESGEVKKLIKRWIPQFE